MKTPIREVRWFSTEADKDLHEERARSGRGSHVRPYSTLIAAMGQHWHEGCWEAVREMAKYTWERGYDVCLYEEHDRCYNPYDAIGVMRNLAYMRAMAEGWENLLYMDNDVKPGPDVLYQLLQRPVPIISPVIEFWDGEDHGISMPRMVRDKGLVMVTNCVLSFLLFKTSVFLPWATSPFWQDALGADEDYHFKKLALVGHRPFVDTDVVVKCMSAPHYPLDGIDRTAKSLRP